MSRLIATMGGVGLLRPAPGTWGSAVALALGVGLHIVGGALAVVLGSLVAMAVGYWAVNREVGTSAEDPSEIVIDELAGQWVALWTVSIGASMTNSDILTLWPGIVTAFIAFRAFDILKPGPVGWADQQHGAFGIMADDVIAGWLAAMVVALFAVVAHLVVM